MDEESVEAARDVHIALHEFLGLEWDTPEEGSPRAEVRMPVRRQAFGFTANLHGGAIATMIDVACAMAAARYSGFDPFKESLVTVDMHVRYLGRPRTDWVIARSEIVKKGRQLIVVSCQVVDEEEHIIAAADFSMMIVPLRQPLAPGIPTEHGAPEL